MTTSTTVTQTQLGQGRTISDVVEHSHAQVNEVFCRKIFRQLLASLELQYGMQMPHRAITPETVVIQENGEPMLLPSSVIAADQSEPADLHALAAVVHYAITRDWPPGPPLRLRGLPGYSESLLGAIDKCLASDPHERPRTIAQLRNLLGIVSLGPPTALATPPPAVAPPREPVVRPRPLWRDAGFSRLQRWSLIALAALVLLGALAALLAFLRGSSDDDALTLTLPPAAGDARGLDPNETLVAPAHGPRPPDPLPGTARPPDAVANAPGAHSATAPPASVPAPAPGAALPARTYAAPGAAPVARAPVAPPRGAAAAPTDAGDRTEYKLLIKPWGTVYVDGQDRGVSPPLKRLALPAGTHTVRIVNPAYPDRVLRIEAGRSASGRIVHDFSNASR